MYETEEPRGEYVLVLEGADEEKVKSAGKQDFSKLSVSSHVEMYESQGLDHKSAMKQVALDRGVSKRDIYNALLEDKDRNENLTASKEILKERIRQIL